MTKDESLAIFQNLIDDIPNLKTLKYDSIEAEKWKRITRMAIERVFKSHPKYLEEFDNIQFYSTAPKSNWGIINETNYRVAFERGLDKAQILLELLHNEIKCYWKDDSPKLWTLIHPEITKVSKTLFENSHYADAVLAALREVNSIVKAKVKAITGEELDGAALMNKTFSPNNPILKLDDITTVSGKDLQQGYMQIFTGAITGIRNPKAHSNLTIDRNRAIHLLFLASLLMFKVDEAQQ